LPATITNQIRCVKFGILRFCLFFGEFENDQELKRMNKEQELLNCTVVTLRNVLRKRGLPTAGRKNELVSAPSWRVDSHSVIVIRMTF
jgi:hypothetical protein